MFWFMNSKEYQWKDRWTLLQFNQRPVSLCLLKPERFEQFALWMKRLDLLLGGSSYQTYEGCWGGPAWPDNLSQVHGWRWHDCGNIFWQGKAATETIFLPLELILPLKTKNLWHTKGFNPSKNERTDKRTADHKMLGIKKKCSAPTRPDQLKLEYRKGGSSYT